MLAQVAGVVDLIITVGISHPDFSICNAAHAALNSIAQCCPAVALHPPTARAVVAHTNGALTIFDTRLSYKLHTITAHTRGAGAVAFSPDGKLLATFCSAERVVKIWHLVATALFGLLSGGPRLFRSLVLSGEVFDTTASRLVWLPSGELSLHGCSGEKKVLAVDLP